MQDGIRTVSTDLERHPTLVDTTIVAGRAVDVAVLVENNIRDRLSSVGEPREAVEHGFCAGLIQLEYRANAGTAAICRAIETARRVLGEPGRRKRSIRVPLEAVEDGLLAIFTYFEDRSTTLTVTSAAGDVASSRSGPIEVPLGVSDQTAERICAARPACKTEQYYLFAATVDLEHSSAAAYSVDVAFTAATGIGGTVEIAARVTNKTRFRPLPVRLTCELMKHTESARLS